PGTQMREHGHSTAVYLLDSRHFKIKSLAPFSKVSEIVKFFPQRRRVDQRQATADAQLKTRRIAFDVLNAVRFQARTCWHDGAWVAPQQGTKSDARFPINHP